jgi:hypothetical protein
MNNSVRLYNRKAEYVCTVYVHSANPDGVIWNHRYFFPNKDGKYIEGTLLEGRQQFVSSKDDVLEPASASASAC